MPRIQRAIEIILARELAAKLPAPAVVVDAGGELVYYNDEAGDLLGVRFEHAAQMSGDELERLAPLDDLGQPLRHHDRPLMIALNEQRPVHRRVRLRAANRRLRQVEVSAFPICGASGLSGAMAVAWDAAPRRAGAMLGARSESRS